MVLEEHLAQVKGLPPLAEFKRDDFHRVEEVICTAIRKGSTACKADLAWLHQPFILQHLKKFCSPQNPRFHDYGIDATIYIVEHAHFFDPVRFPDTKFISYIGPWIDTVLHKIILEEKFHDLSPEERRVASRFSLVKKILVSVYGRYPTDTELQYGMNAEEQLKKKFKGRTPTEVLRSFLHERQPLTEPYGAEDIVEFRLFLKAVQAPISLDEERFDDCNKSSLGEYLVQSTSGWTFSNHSHTFTQILEQERARMKKDEARKVQQLLDRADLTYRERRTILLHFGFVTPSYRVNSEGLTYLEIAESLGLKHRQSIGLDAKNALAKLCKNLPLLTEREYL